MQACTRVRMYVCMHVCVNMGFQLQVWECAGDAVDVQQACVAEAALLQGPVSALKKRLHSLLQEWPEHPVLDQLLAICHRLTGALADTVTCCLVLNTS